MNSPSIYDDLKNIDLGEKVEKLKEHNAKLLSRIQTLEEGIAKLCRELTKMKTNEDNLKKNISSLFKTSKIEIERKDRMIAELRKQHDDLLFKRSNPNFNRKCNEELHTPSREPYFNKRRYETLEPDPNNSKRKKSDSQSDSHEIIKAEPAAVLKTEYHQEPIKAHEGSKSYSKSPTRRSRSSTRHRSRYQSKNHSRSRDKRRNLSRDISRERDRSRGRSNNLRSSNRNQKNDLLQGKDLREVLSSRKSKGENLLKSNDGNKNCNTVIKEALNKISSKHKNIANNTSNKSIPNGNTENCENKEIMKARNDDNKEHSKNVNNEYKIVQIATESREATLKYNLNETKSNHCNNPEQCIDINVNDTQDSKHVPVETSLLRDILNNGGTNNYLNSFSSSDDKLVVHPTETESKSTKTDFEINSDTNGLGHEKTVAVSTISSSRTSMNTSRRRRCVIKIVT